jgi:site-specific DNA recombinase
MIAGVYARKSNEQNVADDAKSVTRQVERAREFAAKKGWRFSDDLVFADDAVSGAEFKNRPAFNRMMEMVKGKHSLGVLIVSEQSRLGRDTIRTLSAIQALTDAGVKIWSYLEDREISLEDEMGEVEQFMKSWAGSSERRKASQRARDKARRLAEQGRYTGGKVFGYATVNKVRTVNPGEAAIVRRIYTRRAEGAGYFKIARELQESGITSPRGSKNWSGATLGDLLTNPLYKGVVLYGRTKQTKRRGTTVIEQTPDQVIQREDPSLQIITPQMWDAVQKVNEASTAATWRSKDGRLKSRPTESKHLLPAFLSCGVCGGSLHIRYIKGRQFLFCTNRHLYGKTKCPNARRLPVSYAEKFLFQSFETAFVGSLVLDQLRLALEAQRAATQDPEPLRIELRSLKSQIANLIESLASGKGMSTITSAIAEREARVVEIEQILARATALEDIDVEQFRAQTEEVLTDWRDHLRKNPSTARQVLRKCLPEKMKVTPDPVTGGWRLEGWTDYRKVLEEVGLSAVTTAVEAALPKVTGSPRRA